MTIDDRFDVNQDGVVTSLEALLVINYLARSRRIVGADGESNSSQSMLTEAPNADRHAWDLAVDEAFDKLEDGQLF